MPRDGKNLFAIFSIMRFRYIEVLIHIFYYYWGKENCFFYQGLHYIELRSIAGSTVVQFYSVQTYPDAFENGDFFLRFSLPSTRKRRFPATKTQVFKNGLQKGDFSKKRRLLVYVWKDENGVFFEYHDVIHHTYIMKY